jgi:cobalt-zinc-cadmium efflux system outer membrane protein
MRNPFRPPSEGAARTAPARAEGAAAPRRPHQVALPAPARLLGPAPIPRLAAHAVLAGLAGSVVLAAAGCVSVPHDAGFGQVHDEVLARSGASVEWQRGGAGGAAAAAVAGRLHDLMAADLTADSAVAVALLASRDLQGTLEDLGLAQADLIEAGLLRNPVLGGEVRFPASPVRPFEVTLAQPVLDLLLLPLRKRVAEPAFAAARQRVADAVLRLAAETRAAFYRAQAADRAVALERTVAEAAAAAAELAGRQLQAGNIADLDLANQQALAEQSQLDLARAEAELAAARERLQRALGLAGVPAWRLAPGPPPLPAVEVTLDGLEEEAVARREDLAALRSAAEAAARALPASRSAAIDTAEIGGHVERDAEQGRATSGPAAAVSLPIFDWGQAARRRAEARYRQARDRYDAGAVAVRSEVREAWQRLSAARRQAELYQSRLLPLRRQILALTQTRYDAMLTGIYQLLAAKQEAVRAEREADAALGDYWVACTDLERTIASRLPAAAAPGPRPGGPS